MKLERVAQLEQSVHTLLADPQANHLTQPQQREWKAIDVALQHLMQKMKGDNQGSHHRPPPSQSNFNSGTASTESTSQPAPQQPTPPAAQPAAPVTGAPPPAWAELQPGGAAGDQGIEDQILNSGDSQLESMLLELETALKAAAEERNPGRGNHGTSGVQTQTMSASTGAMATAATATVSGASVHGASRVARTSGKEYTDRVLAMGAKVGSHETPYGQTLVNNKLAINAALHDAGATDKEKALVMALFMQETRHMDVNEGDRSKDHNTDGSANFSALNMNEAMIRGNGSPDAPGLSTFDPAVNLNDQANIGKAAVLCLNGIRERGPEAWIAGHRGGAPAAKRQDEKGTAITGPNDHDYFAEFYSSVATDYAAIIANPDLMTNEMRVENNAKPAYG